MSTQTTPVEASSSSTISLSIEFGGGLELLFGNERKHAISLDSQIGNSTSTPNRPDVRFLIRWLKENKLKERPELFVDGDTVRPGILVLINDSDWELEGEEDYELKNGDDIVFISTLHGG